MRRIPTTGNSPDRQRKTAEAVNALISDVAALETETDWSALGDYADDVAAAAGGVAIGSLYRTGSQVKVRVA